MTAVAWRASIGASLASVASVALVATVPATAVAAPVSAQQVEDILGSLRTELAAYERTVVVDSRSVGSLFGDHRVQGRYTEFVRRESSRRARIVYRTATHPAGYTVTRHDGEVFLATGDEPARQAEGPLLEALDGMVPVPVLAKDVAAVETTSAGDGGSRALVRFRRPNPSRLIGRSAGQPPPILRVTRAEETAELVLDADGRLVRLTQRYRATIDGGALAGRPSSFSPLGTVRVRFSSTLTMAAAPVEPVARPVATETAQDETAFDLLPEPSEPGVGPPHPRAAPSGDRRAIALARRANAAFREVSAFTSIVRGNLPTASGVLRRRVGLRDGLIEIVRTPLGEGEETVTTRHWHYGFDPFGRCWYRLPLVRGDLIAPWEPGRAPIPLRGSRFFAPKPAGRLVRILVERALGGVSTRIRFTIDRRNGRLVAAETVLTSEHVTSRPDLVVSAPTPIC